MPTTAQRFFLGIVDDDQAFGTTVKKNTETAPAATSTTTLTWTTTTAAIRTAVPLAGSTAATDTSADNGWAFNNGGADGLGSTSTAERWIKPGVWSFSVACALNAPALLATIACTITARVYRVAAGGGARTLLFSASSANFAATATIAWSSAAQPELVLAAGEVIHVGITATSAATANTVGTVTNTVLTLNLGSASFFDVPAPGVRTLSRGDYGLNGSGALAGAASRVLGASYAATGAGVASGAAGATTTGRFQMAGAGALAGLASSISATRFAMAGSGAIDGRGGKISSGVYDMSTAPPGADPDYPVTTPTKAIAAQVLNHETAAAIVGATVRLFRVRDDKLVQTATTGATGAYSFPRDAADPNTYYVTVQVDGATQVHGISDRGLVPS